MLLTSIVCSVTYLRAYCIGGSPFFPCRQWEGATSIGRFCCPVNKFHSQWWHRRSSRWRWSSKEYRKIPVCMDVKELQGCIHPWDRPSIWRQEWILLSHLVLKVKIRTHILHLHSKGVLLLGFVIELSFHDRTSIHITPNTSTSIALAKCAPMSPNTQTLKRSAS